MEISLFRPCQFELTQEAIGEFERDTVEAPRDCGINALQLLKIITQETADVCRLLVGRGMQHQYNSRGISKEDIINILTLIVPERDAYGTPRRDAFFINNSMDINRNRNWTWDHYMTNYNDLLAAATTNLRPGYSFLLGVGPHGNFGIGAIKHYVIISNDNGNIMYVDPQAEQRPVLLQDFEQRTHYFTQWDSQWNYPPTIYIFGIRVITVEMNVFYRRNSLKTTEENIAKRGEYETTTFLLDRYRNLSHIYINNGHPVQNSPLNPAAAAAAAAAAPGPAAAAAAAAPGPAAAAPGPAAPGPAAAAAAPGPAMLTNVLSPRAN